MIEVLWGNLIFKTGPLATKFIWRLAGYG